MRNAEGFGQGASMQPSRAAEGNQGKLTRIAATLNGNNADRFLHSCVYDTNYASGKLLETQRTLLLLQPFAGDAAGAPAVGNDDRAARPGGGGPSRKRRVLTAREAR